MNDTLADTLDILRTIKRSWPKNRWCQNSYAENILGKGVYPDSPDAVRFCGLGIVSHVAGYKWHPIDGLQPHGAGIVAEAMLERKLLEMFPPPEGFRDGSERYIPYVNDLADGSGYEKIIAAIDAILIEHAPKTEFPPAVVERELQPA